MITILDYIKLGLKILLLGSGMWMFWNLLKIKQRFTLETVKTVVKILFKKKWIALFAMCCFSLSWFLCSYLAYTYQADMILKLNYEEASKGQNPNQTRFNASQILSDDMLDKVIKKGSFDISAQELASCLSLSSAYDNSSVSSDVDSLKVATEYRVHCSADIRNYDIKADDVLNLLADVYYEYFLENYAENDTILNIDLSDVGNYDYMDVDDYFDTKAEELGRYIKNLGYEDSSFRMDGTGETFSSLGEKIDSFNGVDVERYRAFVLENGLSGSPENYVMKMDYKNRVLEVSYEKNMAAYNVRLDAIDLYDGKMATIVLVPTSDENDEFYMSRTKIGVDNFANEADEFLQKATSGKKTMEQNRYKSTQIQASTAPQDAYTKADQMITSLKEQLTELAQQAVSMNTAYLQEKRNGYLYIALTGRDDSGKSNFKKGIMYGVMFILLIGAGEALGKIAEQENGRGER